MASISSLGSASGLDLQGLLDKLTTAESAPLTMLKNQQSAYQAKLSAYGTLQSVLSAFQASAAKLSEAATFSSVKATTSNTDVLGVATSTSAVAGSYSVNVTSLAQAQSLVSGGQASHTGAVVTGTLPATLSFEFGQVTGYDNATGSYGTPGFTPTAGSTKTVTIDSSNNSLQGIRDAINKANIGVTASIVNDGSGTPYRLVMTSSNTGESNSMKISSSDGDLQNLIGFDPAAMNASGTTANGVRETVRGTNANLTVNGIAVTSAKNAVTDAVQGVTLTLNKTGTSTVSVTRDTDSMKAAVTAFATAYNNLQSTAAKLTAFDASEGTSSALTGDAVLRNIQIRLRGVLNTPQTGGATLNSLSQIGVSFQKDGTISVDDSKLTKALNENLPGVTQLFGGDGKTGGYGRQISDTIKSFSATDGALKSAQDGINKTLKDIAADYAKQQDRITDTMERYRKQFTQLDLVVSQMNQTSSYLTQQFNALNNAGKK